MIYYPDVVIARSPLSYWRLGEASGTVATDEMGYNNATYYGVGGYSPPTLGEQGSPFVNDGDTCIYQEGSLGFSSGNYIWWAPMAGYTNIDTMILEFWIKFTEYDPLPASNYGIPIINNWSLYTIADCNMFVCMKDSKVRVKIYGDSSEIEAVELESPLLNLWYYYTVLFKNQYVSLFKNGVFQSTSLSALDRTTLKYSPNGFQVGYWDDSYDIHLNGWIDEIAYYDYDWISSMTYKPWYQHLNNRNLIPVF